MFGQAINWTRTASQTLLAITLILLAMNLVSTVAHAADETPSADKTSETIVMLAPQPASWGFDIGFIENGPRTGAEIQVNAPQFGSAWIPQLGVGIRSIDIEGHLNSATTNSSEIHSAEFLYLSAKLQNPLTRGVVHPYGVIKLGALLTSDVANSKASGGGYIGIGGEFRFSELVHPIFSNGVFERSLAFFIETGVPITGNGVQATSMAGTPYIFNGISTTVGFKYTL